MATEISPGPIGEHRAASTASGGTALSTTVIYQQLPLVTQFVELIPRNFSGTSVVRYLFNPWLVVLKTINLLKTRPTDYSKEAQDNDTGTSVTMSSLDTLANGDMVLIGSHMPFAGFRVDVDDTNGAGTQTGAFYYWNGEVWVDTGAADGTAAVRHLDQDGSVTWTVPSTWRAASLADIAPLANYPLTTEEFPGKREKLYWIRWTVSAALESSVTLDSVLAINRSTAYAEIPQGITKEYRITHGVMGGIGCIQALMSAGSANLIVNCSTLRDGKFE